MIDLSKFLDTYIFSIKIPTKIHLVSDSLPEGSHIKRWVASGDRRSVEVKIYVNYLEIFVTVLHNLVPL